jgi:hypothetical protein
MVERDPGKRPDPDASSSSPASASPGASARVRRGASGPVAARPPSETERRNPFRVTYIAILVYVVLLMLSVRVAESLLDVHYRQAVSDAIRVNPANGPIVPQIERRVSRLVRNSAWTRLGDVRLDVFVLGADGRTPLYVVGRAVAPPPGTNPHQEFVDAIRLLPASAATVVSVPPDSRLAAAIAISYGAVLLTGLFFYNRSLARREQQQLDSAVRARDLIATRAEEIESELQLIQHHLRDVEPAERAHSEEISKLVSEREILQLKLDELADREAELRASAARSQELDQERQALEDLLEEAIDDLGDKEQQIGTLQDRLKRAVRAAPAGGKGRASEQTARRMRTLYKQIEFDDRAIQDLVALRDEAMKLRAEESIKRLADDPDSAAIRRKVGGLPPHLAIFELGFAGKGRIYYTRGRKQRHRVLSIGAKNTQKADLDYLSRLPSD